MFSSKTISETTSGKTNTRGVFFQPKLTLNQPNDQYEQEANVMADQVMRMTVQRKCKHCEEEERQVQRKGSGNPVPVDGDFENYVSSLAGRGRALSDSERRFFEPRFNRDFSDVRIHTDEDAAQSAQRINAQAYATGNNIVFSRGQYQTGSESGKRLMAHELTHVVQQGHATQMVQRTIELRPPGRGEASAFERRQEIVDRLNALSSAVRYTLNGRVLEYELVDGVEQTFFDRQMIAFIDNEAVLPLRLITGAGLVGDRTNGFSTLLIDSFMSGYLDLEDMMASDDISFQMNLLHILTERSRARNYARRIGSPGLSPIDSAGNLTPEFRRAHQAGIDAEAAYLQDIFSDPSIRFVSEVARGNTATFNFRSAEGYRIRHTFRRQDRAVSGGTVTVINAAGETVSVEEFIQERMAVAP